MGSLNYILSAGAFALMAGVGTAEAKAACETQYNKSLITEEAGISAQVFGNGGIVVNFGRDTGPNTGINIVYNPHPPSGVDSIVLTNAPWHDPRGGYEAFKLGDGKDPDNICVRDLQAPELEVHGVVVEVTIPGERELGMTISGEIERDKDSAAGVQVVLSHPKAPEGEFSVPLQKETESCFATDSQTAVFDGIGGASFAGTITTYDNGALSIQFNEDSGPYAGLEMSYDPRTARTDNFDGTRYPGDAVHYTQPGRGIDQVIDLPAVAPNACDPNFGAPVLTDNSRGDHLDITISPAGAKERAMHMQITGSVEAGLTDVTMHNSGFVEGSITYPDDFPDLSVAAFGYE